MSIEKPGAAGEKRITKNRSKGVYAGEIINVRRKIKMADFEKLLDKAVTTAWT